MIVGYLAVLLLARAMLSSGNAVFNRSQLLFRSAVFYQDLGDLQCNQAVTAATSVCVLEERVRKAQADTKFTVMPYISSMTPAQSVVLSSLSRPVSSAVELATSALFSAQQQQTHAHFVAVKIGHEMFGIPQFQLRTISNTGAGFTEQIVFSFNFTETRDCAIYNTTGHITGYMRANSSMSSRILTIENYGAASMARTDKTVHVLAGIGLHFQSVCFTWLFLSGSSGKWLSFDAQTGKFLQRVQALPPGSPMYIGIINVVTNGQSCHCFMLILQ